MFKKILLATTLLSCSINILNANSLSNNTNSLKAHKQKPNTELESSFYTVPIIINNPTNMELVIPTSEMVSKLNVSIVAANQAKAIKDPSFGLSYKVEPKGKMQFNAFLLKDQQLSVVLISQKTSIVK